MFIKINPLEIAKTNKSNDFFGRNFTGNINVIHSDSYFQNPLNVPLYHQDNLNHIFYENHLINNFNNNFHDFRPTNKQYNKTPSEKFNENLNLDSNDNKEGNKNKQVEKIIDSKPYYFKKESFSPFRNEEEIRINDKKDNNNQGISMTNKKYSNQMDDEHKNNNNSDEEDNFFNNKLMTKNFIEKDWSISNEEVKMKSEDQHQNNTLNKDFYDLTSNHKPNNLFPNLKDNFFESELVTAFFNSSRESKEENKREKIKLFNEGSKENEFKDDDLIVKNFENFFNKRSKKKFTLNENIDLLGKDNENEFLYGPKISN